MEKINFAHPEIQRVFRENDISRTYLVESFARLLLQGGFTGKITAITICGNLSYDLALSEVKI